MKADALSENNQRKENSPSREKVQARIRLKITLADRKARFLLPGKARCPRLYFIDCCVATELVRTEVLIAVLTPLTPLPVN